MMRICYLAPSSSIHTAKWCDYFSSKGNDISVITFDSYDLSGVSTYHLSSCSPKSRSDVKKLSYLLAAKKAGDIIEGIQPDVLHAHYASSYGALCSISHRHEPYILSVWGSDIYDFPRRSILHRLLIQRSLNHADRLMSTSKAMADEASKYTSKCFDITPFGVDGEMFLPTAKPHRGFVVGTVKSLAPKYGIDVLLRAASIVIKRKPQIDLQVRIAGSGPQERELKRLANELNIEHAVTWLGFISQKQAAEEWANMDVAVIPSESESFGVSAVEAQFCGVPVVVSDVPGLLEATCPQGRMVFPKGREDCLAAALLDLYENRENRIKMGKAGRFFAEQHYEKRHCFELVEEIYQEWVCSRR